LVVKVDAHHACREGRRQGCRAGKGQVKKGQREEGS
jgi:hypothetical protein